MCENSQKSPNIVTAYFHKQQPVWVRLCPRAATVRLIHFLHFAYSLQVSAQGDCTNCRISILRRDYLFSVFI